MTVFVDTSALYALLDASEPSHAACHAQFAQLKATPLLSHSYVVIESVALVERRLGFQAVRDLLDELVSQLDVVYVDEAIHGAAVAGYLASGTGRPSLVDFTSFEVMRKLGIRTAFAGDRYLEHAGFDVIPV